MNDTLPPAKNKKRQKAFFASEASEKGGELEGARRRAPSNKRASDPPPSATSIAPPSAPKTESKTMRILRGVFGFTMVVAIGGGVAYGARRYVKTSPRFQVSEIVTTGAKRRSPDELASTAGIVKGQNVFTTDLDRARTKLLGDPWIENAQISRQLPGTIFVQVTERQAAGLVAVGGETYLATREGAIIKRLEPGDPTELHVVTGIAPQQLVDDREGATRTIRRALDLAFDYERSPLAARSALEEVHVEGNGELTLVVGKNGVMLHMGGPPFRRKLEQAVRVVAELDRRGAKADAIHLDNEARPDRVVVRMR
jgi:cell division protein FtsQ